MSDIVLFGFQNIFMRVLDLYMKFEKDLCEFTLRFGALIYFIIFFILHSKMSEKCQY